MPDPETDAVVGHPAVTLWNRLEPRPRTENFERALRAEVRDPLWMLTRQWQLGEFRGDEGGSPVSGKVHVASKRLSRYQPQDHTARDFNDERFPLEAQVEQLPAAFEVDGCAVSIDLRVVMGRQWLKMVKRKLTEAGGKSLVEDVRAYYVHGYRIALPDPGSADDAPVAAHREAWRQVSALAGRCMDGYAFLCHLKEGGDAFPAAVGIADPPGLNEQQKEELNERAQKAFLRWCAKLLQQPEDDEHAWDPSRLEYQFACSAPGDGDKDHVYRAEGYHHGRLDWHSLDLDSDARHLGARSGSARREKPFTRTDTFLPAPVSFEGMPEARWWAFEDRRVNFGAFTPDTTDLGRLMLMEFGLVYGNDWFLIPQKLPAGTISEVRGLSVTDVFGERFWIEPARASKEWTMFASSDADKPAEPAATGMILLPTVPKVQEGKPLDEFYLVRDEMANMVWAVETRIPLPTGSGKPGREAALETAAFHGRTGDESSVPAAAPLRYRLMNTVPENWIPFMPVKPEGGAVEDGQVQLQRAAMPRPTAEGNGEPVEPRGILLREGLDQGRAYYIHEEEVPRAGVQVRRTYQRTRWYDGKVVTWLGARKQTGRGGGSSGLVFDTLVNVKESESE